MKNAVIISCFDWYENRLKLVKEILYEKGYEVTILTADFNHINKKKVENKNESCIYIKVPKYKKNLSFSRINSHIQFGREVSNYIVSHSPDLIYLLLPPNNIAKYCLEYKKSNPSSIYIIDIIDLWPESMPIPFWFKKFLLSFWGKLRDLSLKEADFIFTECQLYQTILRESMPNLNFATLPLYKEESKAFRTLKKSNIFIKKDTYNELNLAYLGSINHILDMNSISSIIRKFNNKGIVCNLHVIGDGVKRNEFLSVAKSSGANVIYYGKIFDELEIYKIFSNCDYGLNMMKPSVAVGLTIKSIDYLSIGLPLINNIKGDTWNLVETDMIGINYSGDSEELYTKIITSDLNQFKINSRKCFEKNFTSDVFKEILKKGLKKVELEKN